MFHLLKHTSSPKTYLMTLDWEPRQLVPIWLMTLPSEPCHTGGVCMIA